MGTLIEAGLHHDEPLAAGLHAGLLGVVARDLDLGALQLFAPAEVGFLQAEFLQVHALAYFVELGAGVGSDFG